MMRRSLLPAACLILLCPKTAPTQTTITVGQDGGYDYSTIQAAIDAATAGDTIIVHPGTYYENIHFRGKNIVLRGLDPNSWDTATSTVIDGDHLGAVVTFAGTESASCVLTGFTIRHGRASAGGGICGSSPTTRTLATIRNNIITHNWAEWSGGGIAYCDGLITRNSIIHNDAEAGGGLYTCDGSIRRNIIAHNEAYENGGGLSGCDGLIEGNIIKFNTAYQGGGLYCCYGQIQNNSITHNEATRGQYSYGGGYYYTGYGGALYGCPKIRNNIITYNSAGKGGSAISDCWSGTIENNTFASNDGVHLLYNCRVTIRNSIFYGNRSFREALYQSHTPAYSCSYESGFAAGIDADPEFVDAWHEDFHLRSSSPCIDAGDPSSDFSNEPEPNGGRVNMGAYGNTAEAATATPDTDGDGLDDDWERWNFGNLDQGAGGDSDGDGISNFDEYTSGTDPAPPRDLYVEDSVFWSDDGSSWSRPFKTIQEGTNHAHEGDRVHVALGTYRENIETRGRNIVLQSTDPLDPAVVAATIIDGNQVGPVVTFWPDARESLILAGFTIQNGREGLFGGAGICGWGSAKATIRHNVIRNNRAYKYSSNSGGMGGGIYGVDGLIEFNTITGNWASTSGGGLCGCDGTIRNNRIVNNSTDGSGGGLSGCWGTIENNTLYGNSAKSTCGGIAGCKGVVRNCIVWNNSPPLGQVSGTIPTYSCIEFWNAGGQGNTAAFPFFVDPQAADFHLLAWSPCVDAGDPASSYSLEPAPNGSRVNMGVYGNTPEATPRSPDSDGDGLPDDWEMLWFADLAQTGAGDPDGDHLDNLYEYRLGTDPTQAGPTLVENRTQGQWYPSIQMAINLAHEGDEIVVQPGVHDDNVNFYGKNLTLRSADPLDPSVVAATVIDGGGRAPVVTFSGAELSTCILEGFTIRNGYGSGVLAGRYVGWAYVLSEATIRNNVITSNTVTESAGGAVYLSSGLIANNVISGNKGTGISGCSGVVENNTICQNGTGEYTYGMRGCNGTIRNCIVWGNFSYEQLYSCSDPTYSCLQNWSGGGAGNFAHAPHFVDAPNGDYRLKSWSPCVDAGDPASDYAREPLPNGGRVNIGAYGNTPQAASASPDTDGDGLPDDWERHFFGDLTQDALDDPDGDGLANLEEYRWDLNPAETSFWHVDGSVAASGDGKSWTGAFKTIQEGVDVAQEGQTVVVAPATYEENVAFRGRNIVLRSTDPTDSATVAATVISRAGVVFQGTEDHSCVLSGFTITSSYSNSFELGGGITGQGTRATIEFNRIADNRAYQGGGLLGCNGTIRYNTISGNEASFRGGGGLYECHGVIHDNTIADNVAKEAGGGMSACHGMIQNNLILRNAARGGGGLSECYGIVQNNLIAANVVTHYGGGISGGNIVRNTTIVRNEALRGGGVYAAGTISNCIVWDNHATESAQVDPYRTTVTHSCIQNWTHGGEGNITDNPRFADPNGPDHDPKTWDDNSFRLQGISPCIDAGKPITWFSWPVRDLDGNRRVTNAAVDFGCYEYGSPRDSDGDFLSDADEATLGTNPRNRDTDGDQLTDGLELRRGSDPIVATPPGVFRVPGDYSTIWDSLYLAVRGDEIVVEPGAYTESVRFFGKDVTLRSTDPMDPIVVAATHLTAPPRESVVTFDGTETSACLLAGFLIDGQNRYSAQFTGGIRGQGTLARIERNVVTGCQYAVGAAVYECNGIIRYNRIANNSISGLAECHGLIEHNTIEKNSMSVGGGLRACDGVIQYNEIVGNQAVSAGKGGGLAECNGVIRYNRIADNTAKSGHGGALYECDGTVSGNVIVGNSASLGGGLVACDGTVESNWIQGNRAAEGGGLAYCLGLTRFNVITANHATYGGGLSNCKGLVQNNLIASNTAQIAGGLHLCKGTIENNTIVDNAAAEQSGGMVSCDATIRNCVIWGNGDPANMPQLFKSNAPSYSCIQEAASHGTGNIASAPLFVDAQYRLSHNSPCVDAGDPDPQYNDGCLPPGLGTERNDMGAYGGPSNGGWDIVLPPGGDLTGTLVGADPSLVITGRSICLAGTVVNQGNAACTAPAWVEFWAIDVATGWRGYLCDSIGVGPLAAGAVADFVTTPLCRTVYETIPAGTYAIEMRVDATDAVTEWDETNNIARWEPVVILPDRPNLVVAGFDFSPQDIGTSGGNAIQFYGHVRNTGSQPTSGSFWVEFHVCADLPFRFAGHYLCDSYKITAALAPGESIDLATLAGRVTYALAPGVYYVGVRLDPLDEIAEQREDDNVTWLPRKKLYVGPRPTTVKSWIMYR